MTINTTPSGIREYVPAPLAPPSPATAICNVCQLDRDAAVSEGWTIAALAPAMRSREQRAQVQLVINLLDSCERNCGDAGGWRVTQ